MLKKSLTMLSESDNMVSRLIESNQILIGDQKKVWLNIR